jgi:hypothetical protein
MKTNQPSAELIYSRCCVSFQFFGSKISVKRAQEMINKAMKELCEKEYVDEKTGERMEVGVILSI